MTRRMFSPLADIGLAGFDGYQVGRRIRAGLGSQMLLVALTPSLEEDMRTWPESSARDAGGD